jgi:phosphate transport system substrate-binding protein
MKGVNMKWMNRSLAVGVFSGALVFSGSALAEGPGEVDTGVPDYEKVMGISGNLSSIGSDTMNNLMALWGEGLAKHYPGIRIQVEGKGSSTAPPALIEGTAQFGPMSRAMKKEEIDAFEKRFGYKPTVFRVALDALAVFVHRDNPITGLTLAQVDGLFSKTRACGGSEVSTWGDLGLQGDWANRPISLYGRNSASGTYGFFKKAALCRGDYRDQVKEQPGSASVVQGVTEDRYGVGYSGIGYSTSGVRAVLLAKSEGKSYEPADRAHVNDGSYPLWRFLSIYVNKAPGEEMTPLVREFLRFVFSQEGQRVVIKDGYMPVSAKVANAEREKIGSAGL